MRSTSDRASSSTASTSGNASLARAAAAFTGCLQPTGDASDRLAVAILLCLLAGSPSWLVAARIVPITGVGFGSCFLGAASTIMPLAKPEERAGLLPAYYIRKYLAFSPRSAPVFSRGPSGLRRRPMSMCS